MHLTNYSLNKKNEEYEFSESGELNTGSKRTFSWVMDYLKKEGKDSDQLMEEIKNLCRMLMIGLHPFLMFNFDCSFKEPNKADCFQIIGVDIMFDEKCRPWLLEINGNPSLNQDHKLDPDNPDSETVVSPIDKLIKGAVLEGTVEIVSMPKQK